MADARKQSRLQDKKRNLTRSVLLDGAYETFEAKGYVATTIDDLTAAAGCGRATFYLHFNSKSQVMVALLEREFPDLGAAAAHLSELLADGVDSGALMSDLAATAAEWGAHAGWWRAVQVARLTDPDVEQWLVTRLGDAVDVMQTAFAIRGTKARKRFRARCYALGDLTMSAFSIPAQAGAQVSEADLVEYLTELWAELIASSR